MLASLGTCSPAYYAAVYLTARQLPTSGMWIRVTAEKAKSPARLGLFRVEVHLPAAIGSRSREGVDGELLICAELGQFRGADTIAGNARLSHPGRSCDRYPGAISETRGCPFHRR